MNYGHGVDMRDVIISQYVNYDFYCNSLTGRQEYEPPHPVTLDQITSRVSLCDRDVVGQVLGHPHHQSVMTIHASQQESLASNLNPFKY